MRLPLPKAILGALVLVSVLVLPIAARAQMKMAVVDTQRAVMETEDGLRAQATLKKLFDQRQRDLDREQDELQKEKDDIEKQKGVLSRDALQKRVDAWQRKLVQLQSRFVEYNKELQQKQNQLTEPVFRKAMEVISRLARQDGFDIVVDKQAVPYARSDLDITDRVITTYNQGAPAAGDASTSGKPAAKPAPAKVGPVAPKPLPAPVAPKP